MKKRFVEKHTFQDRLNASTKLVNLYPDRIPVICEPSRNCKLEIKPSIKIKYMVPKDITIGRFLVDIRSQIGLSPEQAIFISVNKAIPPTTTLLVHLYEKHKNQDGFLYLEYTGENFFG